MFDQTRDTILNVDCYEIQIYADKYETKFMFGIIKLDLGMTKDQKKEFGLILLYQRLAWKEHSSNDDFFIDKKIDYHFQINILTIFACAAKI